MTGTSAPSPLREAVAAAKPYLLATFVFTAIINIVFLAPTLYMLGVYDMALPAGSTASLALLTAVLALALALLSFLDWIRSRLMAGAAAHLDKLFSGRLYTHCMSVAGEQASRPIGQTLREYETLRSVFTGGALLALFDAPWIPVYLAVCFFLHSLIGCYALAGSLLLLAFAAYNERALRQVSLRTLQTSAAQSRLQDAATGHVDVIYSLGMRKAIVAQLQASRLRANAPVKEAVNLSARNGAILKFCRLLLQSAALGLGAWLAINHQISAGAIFASSMLAARAFAPIDQIVSQWRSIATAGAAYESLKPVLTQADGLQPERSLSPKPQIEVRALGVMTAAKDRILLRDIAFSAAGGQVIGVVGPSGAGKTTLLQVLANARQADGGEVKIGGVAYALWPSEQLGRCLGYVSQDFPLFPGTIAQNISRFAALENAGADEDIVKAAKLVGVHELICALPKGYDTLLDASGGGLSTGQRQRIALARAFYGDPQVLILDEPNAHLDADAEQHLMNAIAEAKARGAIVILSAHATRIVQSADQILVLQDGRQQRFEPRQAVMEALKRAQGQGAFAGAVDPRPRPISATPQR